jgi:tetratricopeptide (TPR) repeat protein
VPDGASVFLDGKEVGVTPQRITDTLEQKTYTAEVRKRGYIIPPSRAVQVNLVQGEAYNLSWDLEPIAVYGSVKGPDGKVFEGTKVWVEGTEYEQIVGGDGAYRFADWSAHGALEPGKTYTLRAEGAEERYYADATFIFDGYAPIQRDLTLAEKTWFEVAQIRFNQKRYESAVAAFQNGIEISAEFPPMSPEFTRMLFDSFSAVVNQANLENIAYVVATAKLADQLGLRADAKTYWTQVKSKAAKGTPEYKLATARLNRLNLGRRLMNLGILVVLLIVLISGGYLIQKQRQARRGA